MGQRPAGSLASTLIADQPSRAQHRVIIGGMFLVVLRAAAARELRAAADGTSLVVQLACCRMPALVDFADHAVVAEFQVVEELLAEFGRSVDLFDPVQRDAW